MKGLNRKMSSAVEVLKEMRSLFNESNSWEVTQERDNALYQALLALEQKEDDRKQGALEELKKIQRMNHRDWKTGNTTLANQYSKIMNKIDKRIKELSGETK